MRKYVFVLLVFLTVLTSCSDHGMSKSIVEPLTVDELRANMKDSTFNEFYEYVQKLRGWIVESDVRQAKYGEITYKRLKKYFTHGQDTVFFNKKEEEWTKAYESMYPDYSNQIDSIMTYWRKYKEQYNMDSLVDIEFDGLRKEYYYSGGIRNVYLGFKITPLKGTVDQLVFRYKMVLKVNSEKNNNLYGLFDSHRCVATSPIAISKTLYWEADYSDENALKGKSSSDVKRDSDFRIELVNIRVNGENYEDKLNLIPSPVRDALSLSSSDYNYYKDDIIKLLLNPDYKGYYDYARPLYEAEMKDYDSEVYELLDEYDNRKQDL